MSKFGKSIKISDYDYLLNISKEAWAWEFLRRDFVYTLAWEKQHSNKASDLVIDSEEMEEAAIFGLLFFC